MSKYEIMLILDPTSDAKVVSDITSTTFKTKEIKLEKLERTELAYEINKSKTANYFLLNVEATGNEINEFIRKSNISKSIWRIMSVNLDTEKGLQRKAKPKRVRRNQSFLNRKNSENKQNQNLENASDRQNLKNKDKQLLTKKASSSEASKARKDK